MSKFDGELACQICNNQYADTNLPRILTMCGHTYCELCISKMIINNISEEEADGGHPFLVQCPEDGGKMRLTVNQLKTFPKNIALMKVMQNKKNNSSFKDQSFNLSKIVKKEEIQEDDDTKQLISAMINYQEQAKQRGHQDPLLQQQQLQQNDAHQNCHQIETQKRSQQDELCLLHQKPLQIICIIDHKKICSKCAIFGQHKGHDFKSIQEVQKQSNNCILSILQIFKGKSEVQKRLSNELTQTGLIQILNKKRDLLQKQVRQQYRKVREEITRQEKTVLKRLNEVYRSTEAKIKVFLKLETSLLQEFSQWEIQSYDLLQILQSAEIQQKISSLFSKQKRHKTILQKGASVLRKIKLQQQNLVPKVQQILSYIECKKDKAIFDAAAKFISISDETQCQYTNPQAKQKPSNLAVSTLIMQPEANASKKDGKGNMDGKSSKCSIFHENQMRVYSDQGSPLLQQSLLETQQTNLYNGFTKEEELCKSDKNSFSTEFQIRLPLQPKKICLNQNNRQQDSLTSRFNCLQLQSAKKIPLCKLDTNYKPIVDYNFNQTTHTKRQPFGEDDFAQNCRSSLILTSRPSLLSKKQNSDKPTKKKLKAIKISEKYQKILQGIYNNTLDTIDLTNAQVGDQVMNQISEFVKFSKARTIKLIRNKLTDNGVEKIIPTLSNAQILNLSQNNLTEAVLDIIIKHRYGHLSGLKNLILSQNKIIQRKHKSKIDQLRSMNVFVSV